MYAKDKTEYMISISKKWLKQWNYPDRVSFDIVNWESKLTGIQSNMIQSLGNNSKHCRNTTQGHSFSTNIEKQNSLKQQIKNIKAR